MKPLYNKQVLNVAAKAILSEQITAPNKRDKNALANPKSKTPPVGNMAMGIAKQIYNSKGIFWDSESSAIAAIKKIKSIQLYKEVQKGLQFLTGGRGIGQYLSSFTTIPQRLEIVNHLRSFIPESQWSWTIEYIVPWNDFKYVNTMPQKFNNMNAGQNNAKTALIGYYSKKGLWKAGGPNAVDEFWKQYHHEILMFAEAAAWLLPVPIVNAVLATAIASVDIKMYVDEGDYYSAGLMTALTVIPGIGALAKLGLKPVLKKMGASGVKKFIGKLKLIKSGKKPVLTPEEKELLRVTSKPSNRELIKREVNAFLKKAVTSKGGKIAGQVGKTAGEMAIAKKGWDAVYTKFGLDIAQLERSAKPYLEKIKQKVLTGPNAQGAPKPYSKLEQIVREEYSKIRLIEALIANQTEGDAFRQWLLSSNAMAAERYNIDPTGPWNSPQLNAAFQEYGAEFKQWQNRKQEKEEYENSTTSDIVSWLPWILWAGITYLGVRLSKSVGGKLIRTAMPFLPVALLEKIIGAKGTGKVISKMSQKELKRALLKLNPNKVLTDNEVEVIRKELGKLDDVAFRLTAAMESRKQYFENFIANGGQASGSKWYSNISAEDMLKVMTDAERKEYGEYVLQYSRTFNRY